MNKTYKHCDILLMLSVREGVPNALRINLFWP